VVNDPRSLHRKPSKELVDTQEWIQQLIRPINFSVCVADPKAADCPLVAVSEGFTELTGYDWDSIVGKNCRMMLDGVPRDMICDESRRNMRHFISRCQDGSRPQGPHAFSQINARADGSLFTSDFLLQYSVHHGRPYIIGLQVDAEKFWSTPYSSFEHLQDTLNQLKDFFKVMISEPNGFSTAERQRSASVLPARSAPMRELGNEKRRKQGKVLAKPTTG
jgi:hypothetical protein